MNDKSIECPNCGSTELTVLSVSHRETLEEFTDYRCAACNHTFENITDLEGEEREEMRNYSLGACPQFGKNFVGGRA